MKNTTQLIVGVILGLTVGLGLGWWMWHERPPAKRPTPEASVRGEAAPVADAGKDDDAARGGEDIRRREASPASCPEVDCSRCEGDGVLAASGFDSLKQSYPQLTPSGFADFLSEAYEKHPELQREFEIDCEAAPCIVVMDSLANDADRQKELALLSDLGKSLGADVKLSYHAMLGDRPTIAAYYLVEEESDEQRAQTNTRLSRWDKDRVGAADGEGETP